jgi:molybdopterin-guanine dinucleotide biosynthesis protein A
VYRKQFVAAAEPALDKGRNKIDPLFREVSICLISDGDILAEGLDASIFRNLNTPDDWQEARRNFVANSR